MHVFLIEIELSVISAALMCMDLHRSQMCFQHHLIAVTVEWALLAAVSMWKLAPSSLGDHPEVLWHLFVYPLLAATASSLLLWWQQQRVTRARGTTAIGRLQAAQMQAASPQEGSGKRDLNWIQFTSQGLVQSSPNSNSQGERSLGPRGQFTCSPYSRSSDCTSAVDGSSRSCSSSRGVLVQRLKPLRVSSRCRTDGASSSSSATSAGDRSSTAHDALQVQELKQLGYESGCCTFGSHELLAVENSQAAAAAAAAVSCIAPAGCCAPLPGCFKMPAPAAAATHVVDSAEVAFGPLAPHAVEQLILGTLQEAGPPPAPADDGACGSGIRSPKKELLEMLETDALPAHVVSILQRSMHAAVPRSKGPPRQTSDTGGVLVSSLSLPIDFLGPGMPKTLPISPKVLSSAWRVLVGLQRPNAVWYRGACSSRMVSVKVHEHPGDFDSFAPQLQALVSEAVRAKAARQRLPCPQVGLGSSVSSRNAAS